MASVGYTSGEKSLSELVSTLSQIRGRWAGKPPPTSSRLLSEEANAWPHLRMGAGRKSEAHGITKRFYVSEVSCIRRSVSSVRVDPQIEAFTELLCFSYFDFRKSYSL